MSKGGFDVVIGNPPYLLNFVKGDYNDYRVRGLVDSTHCGNLCYFLCRAQCHQSPQTRRDTGCLSNDRLHPLRCRLP